MSVRYGGGLRITTSNNQLATFPSVKGVALLLRHRCGCSFPNLVGRLSATVKLIS